MARKLVKNMKSGRNRATRSVVSLVHSSRPTIVSLLKGDIFHFCLPQINARATISHGSAMYACVDFGCFQPEGESSGVSAISIVDMKLSAVGIPTMG